MALVPASNPQLSILPVEQPILLLPGTRLSLSVSKDQARSIITLVQENAERGNSTGNILGVTPVVVAEGGKLPKYNLWGCSARIVRLTRPSPLQPSQPFTLSLQGLTRFSLVSELSLSAKDINGPLKKLYVSYPPLDSDLPPKNETVEVFKAAALKLLDRLAQEAANTVTTGSSNKRGAWLKLIEMVQDVTEERVASFADVMVGAINGEFSDKLAYLSTPEPEARLTLATELFTKQTSIAEVSNKISTAVSESLSKQQKEFFLRQQLAAIQKELTTLHSGERGKIKGQAGEVDLDEDDQSEADDLADLKKKIESMMNGSEEKKMGAREYRRLKRIPQGSVEQGVLRSYLEWLTALPWPTTEESEDDKEQQTAMLKPTFLRDARAQLDSDHFGLEKIKKRLVEYLAIVRLKHMNALRAKKEQEVAAKSGESSSPSPSPSPTNSPPPPSRTLSRAPILLFVGPPGVGKTSLGQSVAKALHRPFQRISLGGVRDEAEIRGHRRTYVASGPGSIIQALRKAGRRDPVLLLDEIDKVGGSNFQGDPSAALLEVLDPEQNFSFRDHYINLPFDLSQVLFICTANSIEGISGPLLDRCEVIQLSGYTYDEKMSIAKKFLVPKQMKINAMEDGEKVRLTDEALEIIATKYTREAGVRSLERVIGAVVRSKAVEWADSVEKAPEESRVIAAESKDILVDAHSTKLGSRKWNSVVGKDDLEAILGPPRWEGEEKEREERRGVVWGLVVMGMGEGAIMPVESIAVPGSGLLKLTGSLGDVIKESGELALSWVKTHAYALHVTNKPSEDPLKVPDPIDVHLHLPAGAQRKDGPSAGVAMVCAFVSLLTGSTVPTNIAMTGEITLRGRVTAVGGIKEKVLGAHRAKITKVILPYANRQDVEQDVPKEIKAQMQFAFVKTLEEALREAFGSQLDWRPGSFVLENRL